MLGRMGSRAGFGRMGLVGALGGAGNTQVLWTPANIPAGSQGPWWDAKNAANIVLNGSNVASWTDRLKGVVSSQGTAAAQPAYSATSFNSTSAGLTFVPNDTMSLGGTQTFANAGNWTMFCLGVTLDTTRLVFLGNGGPTQDFFGSGSTTQMLLRDDNDTGLTYTVPSTTVPYSFVVTSNAGTYTASFNGTAITTTPGFTGPINFNVMGQRLGSQFSNGVMSQIVLTTATSTTSTINKLEGWASWYSGLNGSNLPSGHPYKSRPPYVSDP